MEDVVAATADERVRSKSSDQPVVAVASDQLVVAPASVQEVVGLLPFDQVVARPAEQDVALRAPPDQPLVSVAPVNGQRPQVRRGLRRTVRAR